MNRLERREQRKQDLLLASALLRQQVGSDLGRLAARADGLAGRYLALRDGLATPLRRGAAAAGVVVLALSLRRLRWGRLARWTWLAWRTWKLLRPVVPWVGPAWRSWASRGPAER